MRDAEHGEAAPKSSMLVISPLSCSLIEETQIVYIYPDSLAYKIYGKEKAKEKFNCKFGFNETYREDINRQDLKIGGVDDNGNVRIVELSTHRFFMAMLYLPQSCSSVGNPHPIIVEYLNAAKAFHGYKIKDKNYDLTLNKATGLM